MSSHSQFNANHQKVRKHGLSAKFVSLSPEEQPDFDLLQSDLRNQVKPSGPLEELQFRALLIASWRIETINRMQTKSSAGSNATAPPMNAPSIAP